MYVPTKIVYLVYSALLGPCAVDALRVLGCCAGCLGSGSIAEIVILKAVTQSFVKLCVTALRANLKFARKLQTASTGYSKIHNSAQDQKYKTAKTLNNNQGHFAVFWLNEVRLKIPNTKGSGTLV